MPGKKKQTKQWKNKTKPTTYSNTTSMTYKQQKKYERKSKRNTQTDRQTDRQTDQTDRQTRQTDRQTRQRQRQYVLWLERTSTASGPPIYRYFIVLWHQSSSPEDKLSKRLHSQYVRTSSRIIFFFAARSKGTPCCFSTHAAQPQPQILKLNDLQKQQQCLESRDKEFWLWHTDRTARDGLTVSYRSSATKYQHIYLAGWYFVIFRIHTTRYTIL